MTVLSDSEIMSNIEWQRLSISDFTTRQLQPASYDVKLGDHFRWVNYGIVGTTRFDPIDLRAVPEPADKGFYIGQDGLTLGPGEFVLGHTVESVGLSADIVARVEGKSSLGRLGLMVHSTAGFIDPGFRGQITLEILNVSQNFITLHAGLSIAQLCFMRMGRNAVRPYGHENLTSKYQGQTGAQGSRYKG